MKFLLINIGLIHKSSSANILGIQKKQQKKQNFYITIHFTPQQSCSYISIEFDLPKKELKEFVSDCLGFHDVEFQELF